MEPANLSQNPLLLRDIISAHDRINDKIVRTPILGSQFLNRKMGHTLHFKCENFQHVGAFKARGALNALLWLRETHGLPEKVVTYSSGNHAQAVAWAAQQLGVAADIFVPEFVSQIKLEATKGYGAKVTLTKTRQHAEDLAQQAEAEGGYLLPPFDHDQVICGQGTAALEALQDLGAENLQAIFTPLGGGGLSSGTVITAKAMNPNIKVFAGEPLLANDAARSLREGKIFRFQKSPPTIADGARTLSVSERTLQYLKQLDGIYEIPEEDIIHWTQWVNHSIKINLEPTCALAMAAAAQWLKAQTTPQKILVIISGGNVDGKTQKKIWQKSYLEKFPI